MNLKKWRLKLKAFETFLHLSISLFTGKKKNPAEISKIKTALCYRKVIIFLKLTL